MARQCLCYSAASGGLVGVGGERVEELLGGAGPTISVSPNCRVLLTVLNRTDTPFRGREGAAAGWLAAPWAHGSAPTEAPSGGAGSSQPLALAPPGRAACAPGRVSRGCKPTRNWRGDLTARFAVGPRTCKLSPAHMLHIKPPCPVPFLFFSFERVLINFPSFI